MEYLFVYGMFRDSARYLLGDFKYCGKAYINGKLYKVNEFYPGFVNGEGKVWGDVFLIDTNILNELDIFEGDEYDRVKIITSNDIECWVYIYRYNIDNFTEIKTGDWLLR